ncbi:MULTISPECIES: ABC transporter substrate-binding protein [Actinomycetes]|uniref:Sugar ABC transporter substrate-binding protein n=2 Tax=Actinomycetes TaxID=1760 RepID=A0ABP6M471_9MICC
MTSTTTPRTTRTRAAAGVLLTSALLLTACGGEADGNSSGDNSQAAESDGPVEITFSSWLRGSQEVVDAFNESQDEVQVTFREVAGADDNYPQLTNQVVAGDAPDVVTVEFPRVAEMASHGVLADISEEAGDLVSGGFDEASQSLVTFGGATWSVPLDAGVLQLYYREDLFEEYGIEVPTTWEEYKEAAETVKDADDDVRIGSTIVGDPALTAAIAWQGGAQWGGMEDDAWIVDIDSDETHQAMEIHQEMFDEDLVWDEDHPVLEQKQADDELLSVISGSWYAGGLEATYEDQAGDWRVAQLPAPGDEPAAAMFGGSTFGVSTNSENVEAAVTFIEWMTTTEEGIEARIADGASSVFPINETARSAAADAFDTSFFGDQDIYEVAGEGLAAIPEGWVWGPSTATTFSTLGDESAAVQDGQATLMEIFGDVEDATVSDMESRGLDVR